MSLLPKVVDFKAVWSGLQETIHALITLLPIPQRVWCDSFFDVYSLCVALPEPLPDHLYAETKQYLIDHVAKLLYLVQKDGDSELIKNYYKHWTDYLTGSTYLHHMYVYLNVKHIKRAKRIDVDLYGGTDTAEITDHQLEIGDLALEVWSAIMIAPLGPKLTKLLIEAIDEDRRCQSTSIPVEAIRGTILSLVNVHIYKETNQLKVYRELFEEPFLYANGEYFKREAARLHEDEDTDVGMYMDQIITKIQEELSRARKFLHISSLPKITHQIETLQQVNSIFI